MSSVESAKNKFLSRVRPIDIATLAYIFVELLLILIFMTDKPEWPYMALFYGSSACIVLLIVNFPISEKNKLWMIVRTIYPMFLFVIFFRAIAPQIFIVFDRPFDWMINGIELKVLGSDPAFFLQRYLEIWLNELMSFAYFSYYLQLPAAVGLFILLKKQKSLEKIMLASSVTFYICYIIFILYPVTGPRFYLEDIYYLPIIGPVFTPLAQKIVDFGGHYGASMPSSHSAVSLVIAMRISKDIPRLAIPAALMLILLCASSVYGRYHYLTDVFFGLIIGALGLWIASRWSRVFFKERGEGKGHLAGQS